jgi:hypothetical protein
MKILLSTIAVLSCNILLAQTHEMEKIWETDTTIAVPESVLPDAKSKTLFISLIDGAPWDADGKGGVGKMSFDGRNYDGHWISGLNSPKGMGILGNKLYVADLGDVIVIDIKKGKIEKRISPPGAEGLNDVTVPSNGIVYVSDSKLGKIWQIKKNVPALYLDNLDNVNGLKSIADELFIGAGKSFLKADGKKQLFQIAEVSQNIDGIEPAGNGDFILSAWVGYVWYVKADGQVEVMLNTQGQKKNTADIGYDAATKTIYVPTFNAKTIAAYRLKSTKDDD